MRKCDVCRYINRRFEDPPCWDCIAPRLGGSNFESSDIIEDEIMTKKLYVIIHCPYCKKDTEQIPWDEAKDIYECPFCGKTPVIFIPNILEAIECQGEFKK